MAELQAVKGIESIVLWRKLADATKAVGTKLAFQIEHSVEASVNSDSVVTKDGSIATSGALEESVPFKFILARGDDVAVMLEEAFYNKEKLEQWIIDRGATADAGKYPAEYRQGSITEFTKTATAEDLIEVEGTFQTDLLRQKGVATLSEEQAKAVQYAFRDTTVYAG